MITGTIVHLIGILVIAIGAFSILMMVNDEHRWKTIFWLIVMFTVVHARYAFPITE